LRIAMLAPISWAYTAAPLRSLGADHQSLDRGVGGARVLMSPCSPQRIAEPRARLDGICPAPYSEDPAIDAKVWEMLHVAHVFEQGR